MTSSTQNTNHQRLMRTFLILGSLMMMLSVAIGAFGAHGLKPQLSDYQIGIFDTGVEYQFYHAMGLLLLAAFAPHLPTKTIRAVGGLFLAGIVFFSGSLYLLACRELFGIESWTFLGLITPLGGTFFIIGWGLLVVQAARIRIENHQ